MAWGTSGRPKIDFGIAILALQNKIAKIISGDIPITGNSFGGETWGGITGTLSNQTDLQTALNLKANTSALAGYLPITGGSLTGALRLDGQTITPSVAVVSTHKVAINLGGVTYYLLASII
jgi:hypothetical protein